MLTFAQDFVEFRLELGTLLLKIELQILELTLQRSLELFDFISLLIHLGIFVSEREDESWFNQVGVLKVPNKFLRFIGLELVLFLGEPVHVVLFTFVHGVLFAQTRLLHLVKLDLEITDLAVLVRQLFAGSYQTLTDELDVRLAQRLQQFYLTYDGLLELFNLSVAFFEKLEIVFEVNFDFVELVLLFGQFLGSALERGFQGLDSICVQSSQSRWEGMMVSSGQIYLCSWIRRHSFSFCSASSLRALAS